MSIPEFRHALIDQPDVLNTTTVRARVNVGETISDRLRFFERSGRGVVLDTFEVHVTDKVGMQIDFASNEFDAYLLVRTFQEKVLRDDDGGPGYDALLTVLTENPIRVIVTSYSGRQTGQYELSISKIPSAQALEGRDYIARELNRFRFGNAPPTNSLDIGTDVTSKLEAPYFQAWDVLLDETQSLSVTLSSEEFDPFLMVVRKPGGAVVSDDDSGDGLNSSLELCNAAPGIIRIIATSFHREVTGDYELSVAVDRHECSD